MAGEQKTLLTRCADGIVRTDLYDIPICMYSTLSACTVLRELWESATPNEEDGKTIFPTPGVSSRCIRVAMELVHGVLIPEVAAFDDVRDAFAGCAYLGCAAYDTRLLARLWTLIRMAPLDSPILRENARRLLENPLYRRQCLERVASAMPLWTTFRAFAREELAPMEPDLARFLALTLIQFYPPVEVVRFFLTEPGVVATLTPELLADIVGGAAEGAYYHPAEAVQVLRAATCAMEARGWNPSITRMHRMILEAHSDVEIVPSSLASIQGTTFTFDSNSCRSALLSFGKGRLTRRRCVNVTPWLLVTLDPRSGVVDAWIYPGKMEWHARISKEFQVRLTATRSWLPAGYREDRRIEEVWWSWSNMDVISAPGTLLSTFSEDAVHGDTAELEACVRSGIASLRIDIFYHKRNSILNKPFL